MLAVLAMDSTRVLTAAETRLPNVVFILADDLGWADVGCYGADLHETPHIDQLAREGVRFSQAYAMSVTNAQKLKIAVVCLPYNKIISTLPTPK